MSYTKYTLQQLPPSTIDDGDISTSGGGSGSNSGGSGMKYDKSTFAIMEVYQTQRYYPLAGWAKKGRKQYSTPSGSVFDDLPDEEIIPDGWQVLFLSGSICTRMIFNSYSLLTHIYYA